MLNAYKTFDHDSISHYSARALPNGGAARAAVLLLHGHAEHSGRYGALVADWLARGIAVYAIDHRGHGRSGGVRIYLPSISAAVDAAAVVFDWMRADHPNLPHFIYGHSMGSLLALELTLMRQQQIVGTIISGTPLDTPGTYDPTLIRVAKLLRGIAPTLRLNRIGTREQLSTDPQVWRDWDADPLTDKGKGRVGTGMAIYDAIHTLIARAGDLRLPLLIVHGREDTIAPVSGAQMLYDRAASADKTLHIYDGMRHEIHGEIDKARVFADIGTWLESRTAAHAEAD